MKPASLPSGKPWIIAVLSLFLLLALAGCTTAVLRNAYVYAPLLLSRWVAGYVDLTPVQNQQSKEAIERLHAWHRRTQLPDYAALLARMRAEVVQPVRADQVCRWVTVLSQRADTVLFQAMPEMATVMAGLQPRQIEHMADKFRSKNEEFSEDYVEPSVAKRRSKTADDWENEYERLFDDLTDAQKATLKEAAAQLPIDPVLRLEERRWRQQQLLNGLRSLRSQPSTRPDEVLELLRGTLTASRPAYQELQQKALRGHCELFARIHAMSTPAQREHAAQWFKDMETEVRELAAAKS